LGDVIILDDLDMMERLDAWAAGSPLVEVRFIE
jgi:hypothetical protein